MNAGEGQHCYGRATVLSGSVLLALAATYLILVAGVVADTHQALAHPLPSSAQMGECRSTSGMAVHDLFFTGQA